MKLTAIISVAIAALAVVVARADTLTETWSSTNNAWASDGSTQPYWASSNILEADGGTGSTIYLSSHPTATSTSEAGGLYGGYLYTYFSTPTFTLTAGTVLTDLTTVSFSFLEAGLSTYGSGDVTLSLVADGTTYNLSATAFTATAGATLGAGTDFAMQGSVYAYTFDLSSFAGESITSLTLDWSSGVHNAFDNFTLTQTSASAIPEPATCAAALGGFALAGAWLVRRQRGGAKAV